MNKTIAPMRPPFKYDEYGQTILNKDNLKVMDVRGWGFVQKLHKAEMIQDRFGEHVTNLLNNQEKRDELERAWASYVLFMKSKYGEDFEWTCPHLRKIDLIIKEGL